MAHAHSQIPAECLPNQSNQSKHKSHNNHSSLQSATATSSHRHDNRHDNWYESKEVIDPASVHDFRKKQHSLLLMTLLLWIIGSVLSVSSDAKEANGHHNITNANFLADATLLFDHKPNWLTEELRVMDNDQLLVAARNLSSNAMPVAQRLHNENWLVQWDETADIDHQRAFKTFLRAALKNYWNTWRGNNLSALSAIPDGNGIGHFSVGEQHWRYRLRVSKDSVRFQIASQF